LTSLQVSTIIGNCLGYNDLEYKFIDGKWGSTKRRIPDLEKLLKYYPKYSPIKFKEGIQKVIENKKF